MSVIDFFEDNGPNGIHRCLVFDVMGPSTADILEGLPSSVLNVSGKYPIRMTKSILWQWNGLHA